MTPRMPFDMATSMEPASSGVSVEAPPSVYSTSMSRPASLKKPCFSRDVDHGAVPEAALGDRDLQRFGTGRRRKRHGDEADQQREYPVHVILPADVAAI